MRNWQRKLMRNATNIVLQAVVAKLVYKVFADKKEDEVTKHQRKRR